ncbi:MAG: cysteine desulfurase family protein [Gallintestinimicrobium sp.]
MECYLDNSATTRCLDSAAALMAGILCTDYGNPSSLHHKGVQAEEYVRHAREVIAKTLKVTPKEIFFTSGGTESDNLALRGAAYANARQGKHLITTSIEHPAILNTMQYLEQQGFEVTYLPVDENGKIRLSDLEAAIRPDTILVSIMHTNNEIGALEPIAEAGELIKRVNPNTLFHVDAVQGYGKAKILPKRMKIDMLSVSGHKIHGPKGIGFLYVGDRVKIRPIVFGGGQERGLRSGTENVPAIAGMGKAAEEMYQNSGYRSGSDVCAETTACRWYFHDGKRADQWTLRTGQCTACAERVVCRVRSEVLLHALEEREIYVSAGSACASNHPIRQEARRFGRSVCRRSC